jgi:hypothetical protein
MRIIKVILGIVLWIMAIIFSLFAVALLPNPNAVIFAIPAISLAVAGWVFISKRKRPLSRSGKVTVTSVMALLLGFVIFVVIPDFVGMNYSSSQNACVNNLRQLQAAKEEWALENGKTNGTPVTVGDITPYIQLDRNGHIPMCPAGGTYILGRVGEEVRCSIGKSDWPNEHFLEGEGTNNFTWTDGFKGAYRILFGLRHVQKP